MAHPLLSLTYVDINHPQIVHLVDAGAVKPLCDMLSVKDMKVHSTDLHFIGNVVYGGRERDTCRVLHSSVFPQLV